MTAPRVPPGRAGRLRLRRRLDAAERGADLLERKLHALLEEQRSRRRAADASSRTWNEAARAAALWLDRAIAVENRQSLRRCAPTASARCLLGETVAMGVRLPAAAGFEPPAADPARIDPESAALVCAQAAFADAARAAVAAAADRAAVRALDAAVAATGRQVRTLRRHWIPLLRDTLARLEFVLEQSDFEDGVRRRRAHGAADRSPDREREPAS